MSLQCELSGELLSTSSDEAVVTPSGHICIKRLLLAQLTDNGGVDPFHEDRPLTEDQLVTLQVSTATSSGSSNRKIAPPPRPNELHSMPGLLNALQTEYDALVLELFDTRKALEETRRELSQALYQNDAAMRVVARVAMERDQARQQLEEWQATGSVAGRQPLQQPAAVQGEAGASNKKRKLEEGGDDEKTMDTSAAASLPLTNDIPQQDLDSMIAVWTRLHQGRKAAQKAAAAAAPKPEEIAAYKLGNTEGWHATTCKGITAIATAATEPNNGDQLIVTAGKKDKSILVYNTESKQVVHSIHSESKAVTCVDMNDQHIVAGSSSGKIQVWKTSDGQAVGKVLDLGSSTGAIVGVQLHPNGDHIVVTSESGTVTILRTKDAEDGVQSVAVFKQEGKEVKYTSAALHPDGLICMTGTETGQILLWDLKSRSLAGFLKNEDANDDALVHVDVSNNGYHIAAAYKSGCVRVWDLRKQKCIATLNNNNTKEGNKEKVESVSFVAFDPSGKYLAFGGKGGAKIVTVKEWDKITATLSDNKMVSAMVWGPSWIVACSTQQHEVDFYKKTDG